MRERAQASLLKIVLKSLGVQLSEKDEEADQISFIIKVAMVVVLVLLLIMMISWMVSRVSQVFVSTFTRLPWCTLPTSLRRS